MKKISLKHKLEYKFTILFLNSIMKKPERKRFKIAENLGLIAYRLLKHRKKIAIANVKLAFPDMPMNDILKIVKKSYVIMAKAFVSSLWIDEYTAKEGNVTIKGLENITKYNIDAKDNGIEKKGVMVALIHMGHMEASTKVSDIFPFVTVAKRQRNPLINKLITSTRSSSTIEVILKSKNTTRELLPHIKQKKVVALFSDHRDKGADVTFFGQKTVAPTGAVSLALKYNMPLILAYNVMNDDNTSTTYFEELPLINSATKKSYNVSSTTKNDGTNAPAKNNFKQDVVYNTQLLITNMESVIKKHPEQWLWFHDRWKLGKLIKKGEYKL